MYDFSGWRLSPDGLAHRCDAIYVRFLWMEIEPRDCAALTCWDDYLRWNSGLAEFFFPLENGPRPVYLDMEDTAFEVIGSQIGAPGESVENFIRVVSSTCEESDGSFFRAHQARADRWIRDPRDEPPPSIAIAAFFSLAAERMARGGKFRHTNYYVRLAELLAISPEVEGSKFEAMQRDFRARSRSVWHAINEWLIMSAGSRGLPTAFARDWRTHVGVPISQALLREADRQALLRAFDDMRLPARKAMALSDMTRVLREWALRFAVPSSLHALLKSEQTVSFVADVACHLLEAWDGASTRQEVEGEFVSGRVILVARVSTFLSSRIDIDLLLRSRSAVGEKVTAEWSFANGGDGDDSESERSTLRFNLEPLTSSGLKYLRPESPLPIARILQTPIQIQTEMGPVFSRMPRRLVIFEPDVQIGLLVEVDRVSLGTPITLLVHETLLSEVLATLEGKMVVDPTVGDSSQFRGLPEQWTCLHQLELGAVPEVAPEQHDLFGLQPFEWTNIAFQKGLALPGAGSWLQSGLPEVSIVTEESDELVVTFEMEDDDDSDTRELGKFREFAKYSLGSLLGDRLPAGQYRIVVRKDAQSLPIASRRLVVKSADEPRFLIHGSQHLRHDLADPMGAVSAACTDGEPRAMVLSGADTSALNAIREEELAGDVGSHPAWLRLVRDEVDPGDLDRESEEFPANVAASDGMGNGSPACFVGGAHHWRLPDAGPEAMLGRRPQSLEQRCKLCGLENRRPTRPSSGTARATGRAKANKQSERTTAVASATLARHMIAESQSLPQTSVGVDSLMEALTYIGEGVWGEFESLASQLNPAPWYPIELARDLSSLAFLDIQYDLETAAPKAWGVASSTLVEVDQNWYLAGARDPRLISAASQVAELADSHLAVTAGRSGGPSLLYFTALSKESISEVAEIVSDAVGRPVVVPAEPSLLLAASLPSLEELLAQMPRQVTRAMTGDVFDVANNSWISEAVIRVGALVRVGAYRRGFRFITSVTGDTFEFVQIDYRLGKWLAVSAAGCINCHYVSEAGELFVPIGNRLPGLYERAIVLQSCRLPSLARVDGKVHHIYEQVTERVAALVLGRLGTWHQKGAQ